MRRRRTESSKQFIRMAMVMIVMQTDDVMMVVHMGPEHEHELDFLKTL